MTSQEVQELTGRLEKVAGLLEEVRQHEKHFLILPYRKSEIILDEADVYYVERDKRVTRIHLADSEVSTTMKMQDIYEYLDPEKFVLCHNSFVVNLEKVSVFSRGELVMKNKNVIPVSRSHWQATKNHFEAWADKCRERAKERRLALTERESGK